MTDPLHATQAVDDAITSRHSIRAYLPTPVPRETIEDILRVAARRKRSAGSTNPTMVTQAIRRWKAALR